MRALVFLAALLVAPAAAAQNYAAAPVVSAQRSGNGGFAQASMDVRAPPATVWAVLTDCANAQRFMRDLISCRILERGEGWEVREHRVRGWLLKPVLRSVAHIDLAPYSRFSFRRIGGDWERSDGDWRLTPIDGGRGTHVEYRIDAAFNGIIPVPRSRLVASVRNTLADLRREAEAEVQAAP
ncbi:MAG: SRPBCC family protein [Hyphomonadaceae bacterium]